MLTRLLEERSVRWKLLLRELDLPEEVRVRLLLWRSGAGVNSLFIQMRRGPHDLRVALSRLHENYGAIMSAEHAPVDVPGPVPVSLGKTIYPGIDTAGIYIWDGFFKASSDSWNGRFWTLSSPHVDNPNFPLIEDEAELRQAIERRALVR
jgi:hypothetical protein